MIIGNTIIVEDKTSIDVSYKLLESTRIKEMLLVRLKLVLIVCERYLLEYDRK